VPLLLIITLLAVVMVPPPATSLELSEFAQETDLRDTRERVDEIFAGHGPDEAVNLIMLRGITSDPYGSTGGTGGTGDTGRAGEMGDTTSDVLLTPASHREQLEFLRQLNGSEAITGVMGVATYTDRLVQSHNNGTWEFDPTHDTANATDWELTQLLTYYNLGHADIQGTGSSMAASSIGAALVGVREFVTTFLSSDFDGDGHVNATLVVVWVSGEDGAGPEAVGHMERVMEEGNWTTFSPSATGLTVFEEELGDHTRYELPFYLLGALVAVVVCLLVLFRSCLRILVPLTIIGVASGWTYVCVAVLIPTAGALLLLFFPLLLGLGIDYSVHVIARMEDPSLEPPVHLSSLKELRHPLLLSAATSGFAFLTGVISDFPPVRYVGFFFTIAIFLILGSTWLVVMWLGPLLDKRFTRPVEDDGTHVPPDHPSSSLEEPPVDPGDSDPSHSILDRLSCPIAAVVMGPPGSPPRSRTIPLIVIGVMTIVLLFTATLGENRVEYFEFVDRDSPANAVLMDIKDTFASPVQDEVFILVEGDMASPGGYRLLDTLTRDLENGDWVASPEGVPRVVSPTSLSRAWSRGSPERSPLDENGSLPNTASDTSVIQLYQDLSSEPMLSASLDEVLSRDRTAGLVRVFMVDNTRATQMAADEHLRLITQGVIRMEGGQDIYDIVSPVNGSRSGDFTISHGGLPLEAYEVTISLQRAQARGLTISLVAAFLLIVVFSRSPRKAMLVVTPSVLAVVWLLGLIPLLGIAMNAFYLLVLALVVGLGIDYSIHISERTDDHLRKGIMGASLTTFSGFMVLSLSPLPFISRFGMLMAIGILLNVTFAWTIVPMTGNDD